MFIVKTSTAHTQRTVIYNIALILSENCQYKLFKLLSTIMALPLRSIHPLLLVAAMLFVHQSEPKWVDYDMVHNYVYRLDSVNYQSSVDRQHNVLIHNLVLTRVSIVHNRLNHTGGQINV